MRCAGGLKLHGDQMKRIGNRNQKSRNKLHRTGGLFELPPNCIFHEHKINPRSCPSLPYERLILVKGIDTMKQSIAMFLHQTLPGIAVHIGDEQVDVARESRNTEQNHSITADHEKGNILILRCSDQCLQEMFHS